jgi:hypothetical protein
MNERIRLLAEQAGYKDLPTVRLAFHGFDKEKFAQLIVRECARVADAADENKCEWIGGNVLTHFGVKE